MPTFRPGEIAAIRRREKRFVRRSIPEKIGQPARERIGIEQPWLLLEQEKVRRAEHRLVAVSHRLVERHSGIELSVHAAHVFGDQRLRHRPPERLGQEPRQEP